MSDTTLVNSQAMTQGIDDLRQAHTKLTENLGTLEGQLNSSLGQWEGDARSAYTEAKAKWDASAEHMGQVIQKMNSVLGTIAQGYDDNERRIQGRWA